MSVPSGIACTCSVNMNFIASLQRALTASTPQSSDAIQQGSNLANGAAGAAGTCNGAFLQKRTFGGATDQVVLRGGSITDDLGDTISFAALRLLVVQNTGTAAITVGGGSNPIPLTNGTTDAINIPAGGMFVWFDGTTDATGMALTAGTGCNLNIGGTLGQTWTVLAVGTLV